MLQAGHQLGYNGCFPNIFFTPNLGNLPSITFFQSLCLAANIKVFILSKPQYKLSTLSVHYYFWKSPKLKKNPPIWRKIPQVEEKSPKLKKNPPNWKKSPGYSAYHAILISPLFLFSWKLLHAQSVYQNPPTSWRKSPKITISER